MALVATDDEERLTLEVRFESREPLSAVQLGIIIQEFGKSFDRFARERRLRQVRLVAIESGIGSHWIHFAVMSATTAAGLAVRFRKEIYDFTAFVGKIFDIAKSVKGVALKSADKKLVGAVTYPVASGQASGVSISITGAPTVIIINHNDAQAIVDGALGNNTVSESRESSPDTASGPASLPPTPELKGHFGTILNVKGEWYVRLEGRGGVLNPVLLRPDVEVEDDRAYLLDGRWEGQSYLIDRAKPI